MRFALLGLALLLTGFVLTSSLCALAVAWLYRRHVPSSAAGLLAVRLLPTACGLVSALVLLGSYLRYEPRVTDEPFPFGVLFTAATALALLALAARRAVQSFCLTRHLVAEWRRHGEPIQLPGTRLPAFVVAHEFPVVAVVGIVRPVLFVARQVLARLAPEELQAVTAHEAGHLAARDNLRDMLMRCAPDWLALTRLHVRLQSAWSAAAECDADDYATRRGAAPLALAGALIQVAKLVPPGARLRLPASAFHDGEELTPRVMRLLVRSGDHTLDVPPRRRLRAWLLASLAVVLLALSLAPRTLLAVHEASEAGLELLRF